MNQDIWRNRVKIRTDMTIGLIHLTKGKDDNEAFDTLWNILTEKKLIGGYGYVNGNNRVCCFQEVPPFSIAENLNYEAILHKKDVRYSPFGIRVHKGNVFQVGGRPVIYGNVEELKMQLNEENYWRIVALDYTDKNEIIDWMHEREWRIKGDYVFDYCDIEVIVKNGFYYKKFIRRCIDENNLEMLESINGIISLNSIYC